MRRNSLLPKPQRVDLTKIAVAFSETLAQAEKTLSRAITKALPARSVVSWISVGSDSISTQSFEVIIEIQTEDGSYYLPKEVQKAVQSVLGKVQFVKLGTVGKRHKYVFIYHTRTPRGAIPTEA